MGTERRKWWRVAFVFWVGYLGFSGSTAAQELRRSGFLGIRVVPVAEVSGAVKIAGVKVQGLVEGGSAQGTDLRTNDVITEINHRKVSNVGEFVQSARGLRTGETATLHILRENREFDVTVKVAPRLYESPKDLEVSYQAVEVEGSLRRVIVTAPKGEGRHPAILYLTGIGCYSQEDPDVAASETKLLYGLGHAGFVTMRVEKPSMGDSQGPACMSNDADMSMEVKGYLAGLRALKQYAFVDADNVFVMGLSVGGVEAPQVARQEAVKGLVVINTVAKPFFEYLIDSRRRQMLLRHVAYDEIENRMRKNEVCNHRFLVEREKLEQVLREDPECKDFTEYPASATYMQEWTALNLTGQWKQVDGQTLVVYGTSDFISTINDDPYLVEMINSFHPGRATMKAVEQMDHYMTKAESMEESITDRNVRREFVPGVLDVVKAWLQRQVAGK